MIKPKQLQRAFGIVMLWRYEFWFYIQTVINEKEIREEIFKKMVQFLPGAKDYSLSGDDRIAVKEVASFGRLQDETGGPRLPSGTIVFGTHPRFIQTVLLSCSSIGVSTK
jgi:hypothetical protein